MNGAKITTNKGFKICNQLAGYSQPNIILSVYSFAKTFNNNVRKITSKKRSKLPLRQDMNTSKLERILSK